MNCILFDHPEIKESLLPLSYTRPVSKMLVGILTIEEKWQKYLAYENSYLTDEYLNKKFPAKYEDSNLLINGAVCPTEGLVAAIKKLKDGEVLLKEGILIAGVFSKEQVEELWKNKFSVNGDVIEYTAELLIVDAPWKIFSNNANQIEIDFELITKGRKSQPVGDPHTIVYGQANVFIEEGVSIKASIINAENGPVYIGKNAELHEGAIVQGPCAILKSAFVNVGAKIRRATTIGSYCKVGGEVNNVVFFGNSNKGHEGFLGNAVVGEWCNFGADTNNSNLKNNYANVKLWNYKSQSFKDTGLQFCGLIMGDHSKCGINTMFNTGTVVGVSANLFGPGFPRNFVPSFSWGGAHGFATYQLPKVFEVAEKVMERRKVPFDEIEKDILIHIFEVSAQFRRWENS